MTRGREHALNHVVREPASTKQTGSTAAFARIVRMSCRQAHQEPLRYGPLCRALIRATHRPRNRVGLERAGRQLGHETFPSHRPAGQPSPRDAKSHLPIIDVAASAQGPEGCAPRLLRITPAEQMVRYFPRTPITPRQVPDGLGQRSRWGGIRRCPSGSARACHQDACRRRAWPVRPPWRPHRQPGGSSLQARAPRQDVS